MTKSNFQVIHDPDLAISEGAVEGVSHFGQFGYNPDLTANEEAAIWPGPTPVYVWPSDTGEEMQIVSSIAGDVGQIFLVQALDANWDQVQITVVLNGVSPVVIAPLLARINRIINIGPTEHAGSVSVRSSTGAVTYCIALPDDQISAQVIFSVPRGYRAKLGTALVGVNKSGGTDAQILFKYKRRDFGGVFGTGVRFGLSKQGTSTFTAVVEKVDPLRPKSDVMMRATSNTSGVDVSMRLPFTLYESS